MNFLKDVCRNYLRNCFTESFKNLPRNYSEASFRNCFRIHSSTRTFMDFFFQNFVQRFLLITFHILEQKFLQGWLQKLFSQKIFKIFRKKIISFHFITTKELLQKVPQKFFCGIKKNNTKKILK